VAEALAKTHPVRLEKDRGVYWLNVTDGAPQSASHPLCAVKAAAKVVGVPVPREPAPEAQEAASSGSRDPRNTAPASAAGPVGQAPMSEASAAVPPVDPSLMEEAEVGAKPRAKKIPPCVSKADWDLHQLSHLPFRSWCDYCVRGKAREDDHPRRQPEPAGLPKWCMDYFFMKTAKEAPRAAAFLNCLDAQSGAVFAAAVHKGGSEYALAVATEGLKFTGRSDIMCLTDQEPAVKTLALDLAQSRHTTRTTMVNTPVGSSQSAGLIESSR